MLNRNGSDPLPHWNPFVDLPASDAMFQPTYVSLRAAGYPPAQQTASGHMDLSSSYGTQGQSRATSGVGYHYGIQSQGRYGVAPPSSRPGPQFPVIDNVYNQSSSSIEGKQDLVNDHSFVQSLRIYNYNYVLPCTRLLIRSAPDSTTAKKSRLV